MNSFWDERYNTDLFVYGKAPNDFFASEINRLDPGKILLPGEGEGRNAVYAASRGWIVDAFDQSRVGSEKAQRFAGEMGASIDYRVCDVEAYPFQQDHYDAVGLIYFHASPSLRKLLHGQVLHALKPGGVVILEAFHTTQLENSTGGPQSLEMLFNKELILDDFLGMETLALNELSIELNEGSFHRGEVNIIRYLGEKHTK